MLEGSPSVSLDMLLAGGNVVRWMCTAILIVVGVDRVATTTQQVGVCVGGQHTIKIWSKTQAVVALGSGEAELYGAIKGACEGWAQ